MAAHAYQSALQMAESLSPEERLRLIEELSAHTSKGASTETQHSVLELRGLGKEIWQGMDAQAYVNSERSSWNG
jgi:hypothetical protein